MALTRMFSRRIASSSLSLSPPEVFSLKISKGDLLPNILTKLKKRKTTRPDCRLAEFAVIQSFVYVIAAGNLRNFRFFSKQPYGTFFHSNATSFNIFISIGNRMEIFNQ